MTLRLGMACYGLGVLSVLPVLALAQTPPKPEPPPVSDEASALARCGGGPIQDGHDVQPTPAKDACLARHEHAADPKVPADDRRDPPILPNPGDKDAKSAPPDMPRDKMPPGD